MKLLCVFAAVLVAVVAQDQMHPHVIVDTYPEWYIRGQQEHERQRRDLTVQHKTDNGRVFGALGSNDIGLYGKAGYEHNILNDDRGKLNGQVYGTRILSPLGDSTQLGGALKWQNPNAAASLDLSQINGHTAINAAGGGRWPIGKNGEFTAQGTYSNAFGRQDYGGLANLRYRF